MLGSATSRHTTKSNVMALHPHFLNELYLAKIEHFCRVDVRDNLSHKSRSHWIACVTFHDSHVCEVWYGSPTQVWCKKATMETHYHLSRVE